MCPFGTMTKFGGSFPLGSLKKSLLIRVELDGEALSVLTASPTKAHTIHYLDFGLGSVLKS